MNGNNVNQGYTPYQGGIQNGFPVNNLNQAPSQYPITSSLPPIEKHRDPEYGNSFNEKGY